MKTRLAPILYLLLTACLMRANTDVRDWSYSDGRKFRAELADYNVETEQVTFILDDREVFEVSIDALSQMDQAWVIEWAEYSQELDALVAELGGTFEHRISSGQYPTDYFIYTPSTAPAPNERAMLILFHPGGKAARFLKRFARPAEATGITLVACHQFRNTADNDELEAAMLERFQELLPQIEATVPHNPNRMFMGGSSGGAWRAFHYSAWVPRPWAGIFSNGGWLGGPKYFYLDFPDNMRVALVNGHLDTNAVDGVPRQTAILSEHNATVGIFAFEGGHQVASESAIQKALTWLLEEPDAALH